MFHVKPRQIQPGASVTRKTGGAPGVQSIGQHFQRVARRTVAAPRLSFRTAASRVAALRRAAPPAAQVLAVLARRTRCLAARCAATRCPATRGSATRGSVSLARTPLVRLPVQAPEVRTALAAVPTKAIPAAAIPARAALARAALAKAALARVLGQAFRQDPVLVPREVPANAPLADADRQAPTMVRPPAPCPLGQNLIPRCPAVQFLVGQ